MKQIIEGGHFYAKEGFSIESEKGWLITKELSKINGNESMLFIDNVHDKSYNKSPIIIPVHIDISHLIGEISDECMDLLLQINQNNFAQVDKAPVILQPQHIFLESAMQGNAQKVLELLSNLNGNVKIKSKKGKGISLNGIKLAHGDNTPTCVLYDVGLTLLKQEKGFDSAINVLPEVYKEQQAKVKEIYSHIDPNFKLSQYYFTL